MSESKNLEEQAAWARQLVAQAQSRGYYGKITLHFEGGIIQRAVKEESLKPPPVQKVKKY